MWGWGQRHAVTILCGGRRITYCTRFSISTVWILGSKPRSSDLATSGFLQWTISSAPLPPEFSAEWLILFGRHGFCTLHEVQRQSHLIHRLRSSLSHVLPNTGWVIGGNVFFSNRGTWPVWNRQAFCYESLWTFCLYMAIAKKIRYL